MKTTKRLLAVLLAVMMVAAMMVTTAMALTVTTTNGKITVGNATESASYKVYRILDLNVNTTTGDFVYKTNPTWKAFIESQTTYFSVDAGTGVVTPKGTYDTAAAATLATAAASYAAAHSIAEDGSATGLATPPTEITGLDVGYYLLTSSAGTIPALATLLPTTDGSTPAATLNEKSDLPNVAKIVDKSTASIGDTITYTITLNAKTGGTNYVIFDSMEEGLTFAGITSVTYGGTTLASGTDYTLTQVNDQEFKIQFNDPAGGYATGKAIEVIYTATLNKNAVIDDGVDEGNANHVYMTHGSGTPIMKNGNIVNTQTFKFQLAKTNASNILLDGAKFKLYTDAGVEIPVVQASAGVYRPKVSGETAVEIETVGGVATIQGLGNGTYKLQETAAPSGYNPLTGFTSTITITDANELVTTSGDTYTSGGLHVVNNAGSTLPGTGGIGTTIFYVAGVVLVLGAVVLLIAKKRRDAEA